MNKQQEDLAKLADAFFANLTYDPTCEYGYIGVDCKRPFGNSDVNGDILEIIGAKMEGDDGEGPCWASHQLEYARFTVSGAPRALPETTLVIH